MTKGVSVEPIESIINCLKKISISFGQKKWSQLPKMLSIGHILTDLPIGRNVGQNSGTDFLKKWLKSHKIIDKTADNYRKTRTICPKYNPFEEIYGFVFAEE